SWSRGGSPSMARSPPTGSPSPALPASSPGAEGGSAFPLEGHLPAVALLVRQRQPAAQPGAGQPHRQPPGRLLQPDALAAVAARHGAAAAADRPLMVKVKRPVVEDAHGRPGAALAGRRLEPPGP